MICDDPEAYVGFVAFSVVGVGDFRDLVGDVHHRVHVEERAHVLAHTGQPFQPHAGVDVFVFHLLIVSFAVVDELGEDVVPNLDIAVAVAAHGAGGLAAAVLLAPVVVDLGAGAAGARAVLPEVVLLAEAEDALGGDADVLVPDFKGLVVVQVNRGVEPVLLQADNLGQKLPAVGDGVLFKVVAEGEVAQHLEVGAVAVGFADVFNVPGADALLAGADPVPRGSSSRVNQVFMGAMPLLMRSRLASLAGGIREKLGRRRWPLLSK